MGKSKVSREVRALKEVPFMRDALIIAGAANMKNKTRVKNDLLWCEIPNKSIYIPEYGIEVEYWPGRDTQKIESRAMSITGINFETSHWRGNKVCPGSGSTLSMEIKLALKGILEGVRCTYRMRVIPPKIHQLKCIPAKIESSFYCPTHCCSTKQEIQRVFGGAKDVRKNHLEPMFAEFALRSLKALAELFLSPLLLFFKASQRTQKKNG